MLRCLTIMSEFDSGSQERSIHGQILEKQLLMLFQSRALLVFPNMKKSLNSRDIPAEISASVRYTEDLKESEVDDILERFKRNNFEVAREKLPLSARLEPQGIEVKISYNFGRPEKTFDGVMTDTRDEISCTLDRAGVFSVLHTRYIGQGFRSGTFSEVLFSELNKNPLAVVFAIHNAFVENDPPTLF